MIKIIVVFLHISTLRVSLFQMIFTTNFTTIGRLMFTKWVTFCNRNGSPSFSSPPHYSFPSKKKKVRILITVIHVFVVWERKKKIFLVLFNQKKKILIITLPNKITLIMEPKNKMLGNGTPLWDMYVLSFSNQQWFSICYHYIHETSSILPNIHICAS